MRSRTPGPPLSDVQLMTPQMSIANAVYAAMARLPRAAACERNALHRQGMTESRPKTSPASAHTIVSSATWDDEFSSIEILTSATEMATIALAANTSRSAKRSRPAGEWLSTIP